MVKNIETHCIPALFVDLLHRCSETQQKHLDFSPAPRKCPPEIIRTLEVESEWYLCYYFTSYFSIHHNTQFLLYSNKSLKYYNLKGSKTSVLLKEQYHGFGKILA